MDERDQGKAQRSPGLAGDLGGACGDLGTLLPHAIGAMAVAGLAPLGLLFGFGAFLIASGLFYAMPIAVQPMKVVSALILTGDLDAGAVAATGLLIGAIMLVLGATGAIGPLARLIPQSVTAGLQLGLGLTMIWLGVRLMADVMWLGLLILAVLVTLMRIPRFPGALLTIVLAVAIGIAAGMVAVPERIAFDWQWPSLTLPAWDQTWQALYHGVIPQLPMTLTNAVILTAALSRDLFPSAADRASARNLSLSTGLANLALAPFGAMPMCHGAGGLQAQYRFGARSGLAPILLGVVLLVLALGFSDAAAGLFGLIPLPAVGALLLIAGVDLAISRRLFDARLDCWPAIALTAALTVLVNPAVALAGGWVVETGRGPVGRALRRLTRRAGS